MLSRNLFEIEWKIYWKYKGFKTHFQEVLKNEKSKESYCRQNSTGSVIGFNKF